jgi:hypothetical protein
VPGWVLGCHRSGTSLLCSILRNLSGADGDRLGPDLPANVENPTGFHESATLVAVNNRLLGWAGTTWDRPFIARPAWEDPQSLRLISVLQRSLGSHTAGVDWIDKDPRLCLTRDAFSHLLLRDPAAIAVIRHPLAVATSLHRRNGFSLRKGAAIWVLYNLHLFNSHSRPPETVILFDDLVSPEDKDQERVAHALAGFTVAAAGEKLDTSVSALEELALAGLETLRRYELVRSENHWRDDQDGSLVKTLEDVWRGCQDIIRGDSDQQMGSYLRHVWAAVSPILEREVAIPLRVSQTGFVESVAKSLSSLRGRVSPPARRGLVWRLTEPSRPLGNGSAAADTPSRGMSG